jgi:enterochelin esterase family protein
MNTILQISCFGLMAVALSAQEPARQTPRPTSPNATLKSVEVLPDKRVVFRIYAPKAQEVSLSGEWITQGRGTGGKLEKDEQGVWSITVGPLVPDFYTYDFSVDGVHTIDPKNPIVKPGLTGLNSMFELPGDEEQYESTQNVPHGEVRTAWYESKALDTMRSMHVYTPPGYETGNAKYPVMYLLHGSGDDDAGWSTVGRAGFILDNLIAAKKAKPMIVVMPNGSMPRPPGERGAGAAAGTMEKFTDELLQNVMPYVEKHYRVAANRENRAIAGLSMGGNQTLRVGPANVDKFAYIGVWSAGVREAGTADFEKNAGKFFEKPEQTNKMVKLFWIGVGAKDQGMYAGSQNLITILKSHGITYEYHESEGAHTWINWRHYLCDYAQLLFR